MWALVADDDSFVRGAVARALVQEGFACEVAVDGKQALEKFRSRQFDLVIADLKMPEVNGHKFVVDILAAEAHPAIIVLTGVPEPKIVRDLLRRGVDDVIAKPAELNVLAAKARILVTRRHEIRHASVAEVNETSPAKSAAHTMHGTDTDKNAALRATAPRGGEPIGSHQVEGPESARNSMASAGETKPAESNVFGDQVKVARSALRPPPNDFDLFRDASSCAFTLTELIAAMHHSPSIAADAIHLANSASYQIRHDAVAAALAAKPLDPSMVSHRVLLSMCLLMLITGILVGGLAVTCATSWSDSQSGTVVKAHAGVFK